MGTKVEGALGSWRSDARWNVVGGCRALNRNVRRRRCYDSAGLDVAWVRRVDRAIENLPVFGAIVLALQVGSVVGSLVDALAIAILAARILQSLVHVCFVQTNTMVSIRFSFFSVQLVAFIWLMAIIVIKFSGNG